MWPVQIWKEGTRDQGQGVGMEVKRNRRGGQQKPKKSPLVLGREMEECGWGQGRSGRGLEPPEPRIVPPPSQVRPLNFPEDTTPSWAGRRPTAPEPPNQRHSQSDGGGAG